MFIDCDNYYKGKSGGAVRDYKGRSPFLGVQGRLLVKVIFELRAKRCRVILARRGCIGDR